MTRKMVPMDMDEWKKYGKKIKEAREMLMEISGKAYLAFGNKKDSRMVHRVVEVLDEARSKLENELIKQHPNEKGLTKVFYGGM